MNKFLTWLIVSSKNPEAVSLKFKGLLLSLAPILIAIAGLSHIQIGDQALTVYIDTAVQLTQALLTIVAIGATALGTIRATLAWKNGTHAGLNNLENQP